jgi:hypothetical protein
VRAPLYSWLLHIAQLPASQHAQDPTVGRTSLCLTLKHHPHPPPILSLPASLYLRNRFGSSVEGLPLLALEVSSQGGGDNGGPAIKYVANIHGDEPSGRHAVIRPDQTF